MNMNEMPIASSLCRPPSLSLVTVTSLFEENDRVFSAQNGQKNNSKLSISGVNNLTNFYTNEGLDTISENGHLEAPTIVIDHHISEPDINNTLNNNSSNSLDSSTSNLSQHSLNTDPQMDNKTNNSLVQYLSPPPFRVRRSPSMASLSTESTVNSKKVRSVAESGPKIKFKHGREDDMMSIGGCSLGRSIENSLDVDFSHNEMNDRVIKFLSVTYSLFLIIVGAIICIVDLNYEENDLNHLFIILTTLMGFCWIGFLHWDIQKYKKWAVEFLKPERDNGRGHASNRPDYDDISISTAVIFNTFKKPVSEEVNPTTEEQIQTGYRFLHGKHSGNFYLKCGMTIFCFGSVIHQGVSLVQQIHFFADGVHKCENVISLLVYTIRCIFSFYQLFICFKYSNILINRYTVLARFALMHLVGTSISYWFSTIIEEAVEDYVAKLESSNESMHLKSEDAIFYETIRHHEYCSEKSIVNMQSLEALPYLYPFTIEYNIILASVWYIIWTNIGKDDANAYAHQIRREISENAYGEEEIQYKSAISINADCHASNRGLFGGLSILLLTFITIVVFFTTIKQDAFSDVGVGMYSAQIGTLTILSLIVVPLAYKQIRKLDTVDHHHQDNPSTAMDDLLVLVPLPFYFIHHILSCVAAAHFSSSNNLFLIIINLLTIVQVIIQSPVIVDGLRRCSNSKKLRFAKPGRELVTFALILNLTLWILNTFEMKSVDSYHGMSDYYGKLIWMIISHTTMPLILFYRFHCSVCLSDIWKYAYEKDDSHLPNI